MKIDKIKDINNENELPLISIVKLVSAFKVNIKVNIVSLDSLW